MSNLPLPPDFLDEVGQKLWNKKIAELAEVNLFNPMFEEMLATFCQAYSDFVYAVNYLQNHDRISVSEKGAEYQHPMVGQKNKSMEQLIQFGKMLSMTPKELKRLEVRPVEEEEDEVSLMMES